MTRLQKISGVLDHLSHSVIGKADRSRGVRAEVIIGIVLVLSTMALGLGISIMSERSVAGENINASPVETPPEMDLSNFPSAAANANSSVEGQSVTVSAPFVNAQAGTDIDVDVMVTDTTNLNAFSYQGDILYDPTVLLPRPGIPDDRFLGVNMNQGSIGSFGQFLVNPYQSGRIKVVWFNTNPPISGAGLLFRLKFVVIGPIGSTSPLHWETNPLAG